VPRDFFAGSRREARARGGAIPTVGPRRVRPRSGVRSALIMEHETHSLESDVRRLCESLSVPMVSSRPRSRSSVVVQVRPDMSEVTVHHGPLDDAGRNAQVEIALDDLFTSPRYRVLKRDITPEGIRYVVSSKGPR
jgi:hypothetical protein